jgi:site-specific recombinase XerD
MMKTCTGAPSWREAIRFFLQEYLPRHRGLSPRTQESYATALSLLLREVDAERRLPHTLSVLEVLRFLEHLESQRKNCPASRNLRLAALKSFWKAMVLWNPAHRVAYEVLLRIPQKRAHHRTPDYLERDELAALFACVDPRSHRGFRDLTLLRYLYNTGSRISELADARVEWLCLTGSPHVTIRGKGGKCRICPLLATTVELLRVYLRQERPRPGKGYEEFLFLTRSGTRFTRGGMWKLIRGYLDRAAEAQPSLRHKRLTPHSLRHTTAVFLLRAGVEINVIRAWLGHANVATTSHYLDLDLDKKREALERFGRLDLPRLPGADAEAQALPATVLRLLERL